MMSKRKSKPVKKVSKDKQIAQLKRELKAAKVREVNNARVFAYALDLYRPDPPNTLGAQKSTPAQDLLTLAVKISDQHANSRITVTASPDGTTSVSIEPVTQRTTEEEPEEIEKEKPALDTEFWNQKGQTFSATAYAKDKAGKRVIVKGVDWTPASLNVEDAIEKVSDAFAQVAGSPSELKAMKTELRKMGIPS
jgi:hypothetical protein